MSGPKVEDLRLPAAVIARILKDALPANAAVSKEAKTALSRAAAVFIMNVTTYANEYAEGNSRKTVGAPDVFQAVRNMQCEQLEKPLREAVEVWKVNRNAKLEEAKKRRAEKKANEGSLAAGNQEASAVADIEDL